MYDYVGKQVLCRMTALLREALSAERSSIGLMNELRLRSTCIYMSENDNSIE